MLVLSPLLTAISLAATPVFVLFSRRVGRARRKARGDAQASLAVMGSITQETLSVSGILLAKVFGRQEHEVDRYRAENANQANLQTRQAIVGRSFFAVTQAFFGISPALVYLVAGLQGTHGDLSAGTLVAFTTLQSRLLIPINQLLQVSVDVQSSLALFGRIFELIDLQPRITDRPDALAWPRTRFAARSRSSTCGFDMAAARTADRRPQRKRCGASRCVSPLGSSRRWLGPPGRAKRRLVPDTPALRRREGGCQNRRSRRARPHRRDDRPRGRRGHSRELSVRRHRAREHQLRAAGRHRRGDRCRRESRVIHDRIIALEHGYDTLVGERGYRFSGGERQRLAIARLILEDPPILVLDEATSALDTESERVVQRALESLIQRRTTIAIAHRLSTIRNADVIFAIDNGTIVERGTHDELLAQGGLYARLYEEQFGNGVVEAHCSDGVILANGEPCRPSSQRPRPDGQVPRRTHRTTAANGRSPG